MQKEKPTQRIEQEATSYFKKGFFPRETCRTNFGEWIFANKVTKQKFLEIGSFKSYFCKSRKTNGEG